MFVRTKEHKKKLADLSKHSGSYSAMIYMLTSELLKLQNSVQ